MRFVSRLMGWLLIKAVFVPKAGVGLNVFRNHAVIGFIADDVVVKGTLPKVLIERCGLPALDKTDVLDGRIPFERLHDAPTGSRFGPNNILR